MYTREGVSRPLDNTAYTYGRCIEYGSRAVPNRAPQRGLQLARADDPLQE